MRSQQRVRALAIALGVLSLSAAFVSTRAVAHGSGGTQRVLPVASALEAARPVTLNEALALAKAAFNGDILSAQSVNATERDGIGGRASAWNVTLATAQREVTELRIQDGAVVRAVATSRERGAPLPAAADTDTDIAYKRAIGAGLQPGMGKAPGYVYEFQSRDGAAMLSVLGSSNGTPARVDLDPRSGALRGRYRLVPTSLGGVMFSADGGETWSATDLRGSVFAITNSEPVAALIEEPDALRVSRSDDGSHWTTTAVLPSAIGRHAFTLRGTPTHELLLGATTGLWRSQDGGLTWSNDGLFTDPVQYIEIARTGASVALVLSVAAGQVGAYLIPSQGPARQLADHAVRLSALRDGRVALIDETSRTAGIVDAAGDMRPLRVPSHTLRVSGDDSLLYAATPEAVFTSKDRGNTWTVSLLENNASLAVTRSGVAVVGGFRTGVYVSDSDGNAWKRTVTTASTIIPGSNEIWSVVSLSLGVLAIQGGMRAWQPF